MALFTTDLLGLWLSLIAVQSLRHQSLSPIASNPEALAIVVFAFAFWLVLFERIGMYRRSFSVSSRDEIYATVAASGMATAPAIVVFWLVPVLVPFRGSLIFVLLLSAVAAACARFVAHLVRTQLVPRRIRRVAVVGTQENIRAIVPELALSAADLIVRLPTDAFDDELPDVTLEQDPDGLTWLQMAVLRGCDEVIVTETIPPESMPALLRLTEKFGVKLAFAPLRLFAHACDFDVARDGGLALFFPRTLAICTPGAEIFRRCFDLAIAVPALVLCAPLLLAIALAVFLEGGAPILYRQTRVGRRGKTFEILKFRTMLVEAESETGPVWTTSNNGESRTTSVGRILRRFSLDELPQLLNVIYGDMSLVGPRPERPFYVEQFRQLLPRYDERHLVRPGITGWSHVNMRRNVDTSAIGERLSYDIFYLEHWSVFMDLMILFKTTAEFLFHSAA
jgi:exopolysaccharide biosynthesis polyprenyl glycosylphosphotransferase